MSTPNIDNALTAIEAAEGTIAKLVDKRGAANDRRAALSREIEQYSFAAHAEDDPAAKKKLADLSRAALSTDQEDERGEVKEHACAGLLSARVGTR